MAETIELGDGDCAIVVREDCSTQMFLAMPDDQEGPVSDATLLTAQMAMALNDQEIRDLIAKKFDAMVDEELEDQKEG